MFTILLVNALFSAVFPMGKIAMALCPPFMLVGLRMLAAGFFLGLFALFQRNNFFLFIKQYRVIIFFLAFFNIYLANAFEFWGLQFMSSAKTCFIYNLAPFFSAVLAYIFFKEKITINKIIGLVVSFLGFIPILMTSAPGEKNLTHMSFLSSAELSVLLATLAAVCGWLIMQQNIRYKNFDAISANAVSMFLGGIFSVFHSYAYEAPLLQTIAFGKYLYFWVIALAFITIISFLLYTRLLKKFSTTFLTFTGLTGPFFAAFYDWIIFGTIITWHFYCATALVFFGLYLFYKDEFSITNLIT